MFLYLCAICKLLPTDVFLNRKMQEMRFWRGLLWTLLGELIVLPRWMKGAYF